MRTRSLLTAATVTVAGFAAGLVAGNALEGIGTDPSRTWAPTRAAAPYAGTVPPGDAKVLSSDALADIELADRHGRTFTLDRTLGNVVVVGFASASCGAGCARRIEALLRTYRHLGERPSGGDLGTDVEFVLVSSAAAVLPAVATASKAPVDGRRWRVVRAEARELGALRERLGLVAPTGANANDRPAVHLLDAAGRLVQRYRADPLDVARLSDDVAWLRGRGS